MVNTHRFVALKSRDFRLLWIGNAISAIGNQIQSTTIHWHIFKLLENQSVTVSFAGYEYDLGASALGLGGIGLARILPIFLFSVLGGAIADVRDRRKLILVSSILATVLASILSIFSFLDLVNIWVIYAITAGIASTMAFSAPARQALIPNLVPREHMTNAISLGSLSFNIAQIGGPAIGGLIIAELGIGMAYFFNTISFFAVIFAIINMSYRSTNVMSGNRVSLSAMKEGFVYVYRERMIWSTMLLDFFATFFSSAQSMLPIVAGEILGLGPRGYGILATGQALGAVSAGLYISLRTTIHRQGKVLLGAVIVYGLATALFGISTVAVLSYVFYALTGVADAISTVIRNTIRQMLTPDNMRGRMIGVNMLFFQGGPQLGELEAGAVAAAFGVPFAIISGGVATVLLTLWVAWRYPRLRNYTVSG